MRHTIAEIVIICHISVRMVVMSVEWWENAVFLKYLVHTVRRQSSSNRLEVLWARRYSNRRADKVQRAQSRLEIDTGASNVRKQSGWN